MAQILIQYVLVICLVFALFYLVYLLRDKGDIQVEEDYFGITHTILTSLEKEEATPENIKTIIRIITNVVSYVEENYTDVDNNIKENKALILVREDLEALKLKNTISIENTRYLIRLCCGFMSSKSRINN